MIRIEEKLTLITPCFCAGADQNKAELRAPSIRGQLRWWFRVLGGTPEQEKELFGGVHEGTNASKIVVRVKDVNEKHGKPEDLPRSNTPLYYLFHFANASGKQRFDRNGPRYEPEGWLKEDTTFTVEAFSRLPMKPEEETKFHEAWDAFIKFGGLGYRQTRGLGAFTSQKLLDLNQMKQALRDLAKYGIRSWMICELNGQPSFRQGWRDSMRLLEAALGYIRQHGFKSDYPSPMGSSSPRQASGLHLRPVLLKDGYYLPVMYYTPQILAPHSSRLQNAFLTLLDGNILFKYPYEAIPKDPDTRDEEYKIMKL